MRGTGNGTANAADIVFCAFVNLGLSYCSLLLWGCFLCFFLVSSCPRVLVSSISHVVLCPTALPLAGPLSITRSFRLARPFSSTSPLPLPSLPPHLPPILPYYLGTILP
jgi:hypothetical protein